MVTRSSYKGKKPQIDTKKVEAIREVSDLIVKKFEPFIKAIWIFGSVVKGAAKPTSDVDLLIVLDDTKPELTAEIFEQISKTANEISESVAQKKRVKIHVQSPRPITEVWELVKSGEPWLVDSIRTAVPLYDRYKFFQPLQRLLVRGRIPGTIERTEALINRAPARLNEIRRIFLEEMVSQILFTTVEASQALLMLIDVLPPAPSRVSEALKKNFLKEGFLDVVTITFMDEIYTLYKKIAHGQISYVTGAEIDVLIKKADNFLARVEEVFVAIYETKKKEAIINFRKELLSSCREILTRIRHEPKTEKQILPYFETYIIRKGILPREYYEVAGKIDTALRKVEKGETNRIPEADVYEIELDLRELSTAIGTVVRGRKKK